MNTELDQEVDEAGWIREHPVYCPVPWCSAHDLRRARCGDGDGPYEGLHVARIEYARGEAARDARQIGALRKLGVGDPELMYGFARMGQEAVDLGLVPGRRGRRKLI